MKYLLEVLLMEAKSGRQPRILLVKNREVKYRICTKRNNIQEWIKSINGIMSRFQKHNAAIIKDKKCEISSKQKFVYTLKLHRMLYFL